MNISPPWLVAHCIHSNIQAVADEVKNFILCFINQKTSLRVFQLIEAIMRDPFQGIGKPEPLKFLGACVWSRRITQEHRLVYVVGHERIDFIQARYHYG